MPEEINRLVTDAVSSYLFTPSRDADENLKREGRSPDDIYFVGNVMVDTLQRFRHRATRTSSVLRDLGLRPGEYAVLTVHRPSNVDDARAFEGILEAVESIGREIPVVYPVHPRSRDALEQGGLSSRARGVRGLKLTSPLGYLDFLALEAQARLVMTDSGGVQEETTVLGVPCLTLRPNTERPVTVTEGTNTIVGSDPSAIVAAAAESLARGARRRGRLPEYWDGRAAERIADTLEQLGEERRS